jgi:DNA-binding Xre family transcriptional regulator
VIANYNKLWKLLIDKGMNKTQLQEATKISTTVIAKMGKCEPVRMETLMRICSLLECDVGDIVEFIPSKNDKAANIKAIHDE